MTGIHAVRPLALLDAGNQNMETEITFEEALAFELGISEENVENQLTTISQSTDGDTGTLMTYYPKLSSFSWKKSEANTYNKQYIQYYNKQLK